MPNQLSQYYPSFPNSLDSQTVQLFKQLWDRVNFLIERLDTLQQVAAPVGQLQGEVGRLKVALQAASDTLTQGRTFVAFDQSQPVSDAIAVSLAGLTNGLTFSGTTSTVTFTVTNAATFRSSVGAATSTGITATTLTLAKITGGGSNGSITLTADGCISAYVAPT